MVVAAAGRHQVKILDESEEPAPFGIGLVGVADLHAGQAYGGQPGNLLVRHVRVPAGPRVGQHRDAAGGATRPIARTGSRA